MNKSYKIGLLGTALLCAVVIGYYALWQEPARLPGSRVVPNESVARDLGAGIMPSSSTLRHPSLNSLPDPSTPYTKVAVDSAGAANAVQVTDDRSTGDSEPAPQTLRQTLEIVRDAGPAPVAPTLPAAAPSRVSLSGATQPSATVAAAPRATATVAAEAARPYTIKSNDTFQSIAVAMYGSDGYAQDIAYANPTVDPRKLKIGQVIRLPTLAQINQQRNGPDTPANGETTYVTGADDTLWSIAVQFYGDGTQWQRIYRENRARIGANPDSLEEGLKLRIPPRGGGSSR